MLNDFIFDVDLSDQVWCDEVVRELAASILTQAGCPAAAVDEAVLALRGELAQGVAAGRRPCRLQFRKRPDELEILVSCAGGPERRIARGLP